MFFGRIILGMLARRVIGRIAARHGDVAGAALSAALLSRRARGAGVAGIAALTAYDYVARRRDRRAMRPANARAVRA